MYSHTPPLPPPKPSGSHETTSINTPETSPSPRLLQRPETGGPGADGFQHVGSASAGQPIPDPGEQWLPKFLQDKSKQDLAEILSNPSLLSALTHSPETIHPSLQASHDALQSALAENVQRAAQLLNLEARLANQRSLTQAQLLSTHALERQWRAKQAEMDHALTPFAPTRLYQRLSQGLQEQEAVCCALEESFLDSGGDDVPASEREANDWVRKYREAKKLYYLRQERKERWDEGRVGGWR
ncbi:hypothetical protein SMACR_08460 [Sordaria macrospora]|uniref:WGS project CABT00000000 data, contig 2.58 n=2 Tax=Sordaria macrospora TaxID=5147 RepID=F7WA56_SORMK|nr:uncharacterized protein SMAC_08460 [Sordaria macrospora k-hell]KAA8628128.1 hypothetical protein SMACR_08460 [Sordaria macrospora]KAH7635163.1 hypothetical protein B0T09DRAFT_19014 [Sordaria sp. MPI-SDFR-AT-0083]WPJ58085.1 hypothetical protein SMAC4_08460 [Sordaria macrospora]CCC14119.1 unnamed protein product [Sordaria macrospora k-hell]